MRWAIEEAAGPLAAGRARAHTLPAAIAALPPSLAQMHSRRRETRIIAVYLFRPNKHRSTEKPKKTFRPIHHCSSGMSFLHSSPSRQVIDPLIYGTRDSAQPTPSADAKATPLGGRFARFDLSVPPSAQKYGAGWTPLILRTHEAGPGGPAGAGPRPDDYHSLSLTPFLTHNFQTSAFGALGGITPFHDKTFHLTDFFMDSPIRQTPLKDLEAITPSKFRLGSAEHRSVKQLLFQDANPQKRSIAQVDTPPRQHHKLSNLSISAADEGSDDDSEEEAEREPSPPAAFATPSRKLRDVSNTHRFETPKPAAALSPSTVILSSTVKSPPGVRVVPPSPTPQKEGTAAAAAATAKSALAAREGAPTMGVFLEAKRAAARPRSAPVSGTSAAPRASHNKAQMRAGMNKFQIVLTDVHTLMNGKKKKKKRAAAPVAPAAAAMTAPPPGAPPGRTPAPLPVRLHHSFDSLHNNSMNTSHLNMSTDHSSFELGGTASTPNSKYFLDKMFDKSPNPAHHPPLLYGMPPPSKPESAGHAAFGMMSTPQHLHVLSAGYSREHTPETEGHRYAAFAYHQLGEFKEEYKGRFT